MGPLGRQKPEIEVGLSRQDLCWNLTADGVDPPGRLCKTHIALDKYFMISALAEGDNRYKGRARWASEALQTRSRLLTLPSCEHMQPFMEQER